MSLADYEVLVREYVDYGSSLGSYQPQTIGGGFWRIGDGTWTDFTLLDGADDHRYLCYPNQGLVRATAAVLAGTTDAPASDEVNITQTLTDAGVDFVAGLVVPYDILVLPTIGATASITAVTDATHLEVQGLTDNATLTGGQPYAIVRAPGTDTAEYKRLTARPVAWRDLELGALDQIEARLITQLDVAIGGSSLGMTRTMDMLRQRRESIRGVVRCP